MNKLYDLFAVVAPGLENISWKELKSLGFNPIRKETGGITIRGDLETIYRINLFSRTISRLLVRLGKFHASAFSELRKKAGRLSWEDFLDSGQTVTIRAKCHRSKLYHSKGVIERVSGAISDRLGEITHSQTPIVSDGSNTHQMIIVRISNDECLISVDTSGEALHRRGYRLQTAKAPLKENLAAAIIMSSGWDLNKPLLDPLCGSGTIPIEAALMARNIPPGLKRQFGFMNWRKFNKSVWHQIVESIPLENNNPIPIIQGSDRDKGAIEISMNNSIRAGVEDFIQFKNCSISAIAPPKEPGYLISNPPYGKRVRSNKDIRNLYAQLGNVAKLHCMKWQVVILSSDPLLFSQVGFKINNSIQFSNGGINVWLGRGTVPDDR